MENFKDTTKEMTSIEILNYYRNLFHAESLLTERGIIANALNDILTQPLPCDRWVKCEDEMPKERKACYVTYITDKNEYLCCDIPAYHLNKTWYLCSCNLKLTARVIAWQYYQTPAPYHPK